jgi:hypothetical protein
LRVPIIVSGEPVTPKPSPLAPGAYLQPFPEAGVSIPALLPYQFWFNGFTFGPNTALELKKINGMDMPTVRSGDSGRPRDHGLFVGLDVMGGRELTLEGDLSAHGTTTFVEAWQALSAATVPGGTVQAPLYFGLPGYGTLVTQARVRKRQMPIDITFSLGNLAGITLLFAASDPRAYGAPTVSSSVVPPNNSGGFGFPLGFPVTFGAGSGSGALSVTNNGDIETRPRLIVEGPCTNPSITLASVEESPNLTFNLAMNAGDRLVLDTDLHKATYYTAGSTFGVTRIYALEEGSQWFTLPPGTSTIQFRTSDPEPTGLLTCESASAWVV